MMQQGHNRLPFLEHALESAMQCIIAAQGEFPQLCVAVRCIAEDYPEFIVWSPQLYRTDGVLAVDVWDHSWRCIARVQVKASQELLSASVW